MDVRADPPERQAGHGWLGHSRSPQPVASHYRVLGSLQGETIGIRLLYCTVTLMSIPAEVVYDDGISGTSSTLPIEHSRPNLDGVTCCQGKRGANCMRPCASSLSEVTYFLHHEAQAQAHSTRQTLHLSIARGSTKSRGARGATSTLYSTRRDAGHKVTESQSTVVTATGPRKNGFPEVERRGWQFQDAIGRKNASGGPHQVCLAIWICGPSRARLRYLSGKGNRRAGESLAEVQQGTSVEFSSSGDSMLECGECTPAQRPARVTRVERTLMRGERSIATTGSR